MGTRQGKRQRRNEVEWGHRSAQSRSRQPRRSQKHGRRRSCGREFEINARPHLRVHQQGPRSGLLSLLVRQPRHFESHTLLPQSLGRSAEPGQTVIQRMGGGDTLQQSISAWWSIRQMCLRQQMDGASAAVPGSMEGPSSSLVEHPAWVRGYPRPCPRWEHR